MHRVLLALGANLDAPAELIGRAVQQIKELPDCELVLASEIYHSTPIGGPDGQGEFCNATVEVETKLEAEQVLSSILAIENRLGRVRSQRWDSRLIDIDLILFDRVISQEAHLLLPHPRFSVRRFVLEPAVQMGSSMVDPVSELTCQQLLDHLDRETQAEVFMLGWNADQITSLSRALANDKSLAPRFNEARLTTMVTDDEPVRFTVLSDAVLESKLISTSGDAYNPIVSTPWCVIEQTRLASDRAADRLKHDVHAALVASSATYCPLRRLRD